MDNTAGSLTQLQKAVVIGSMLGDGYIRKMKGRRNAFLEINHSFKQKEYVDWKYDVLKNLTKSKPKIRYGKENRIAYRFYTKQLSELTEIMNKFYVGNIKVIPDIKLDPIALAVWYMDDGGRRNDCHGMFLNTLSYSEQEQIRLQKCLLKNFGIHTRIHWITDGFRLYIPTEDSKKFSGLIGPYIIPSMIYKLPYNTVTTESAGIWRRR